MIGGGPYLFNTKTESLDRLICRQGVLVADARHTRYIANIAATINPQQGRLVALTSCRASTTGRLVALASCRANALHHIDKVLQHTVNPAIGVNGGPYPFLWGECTAPSSVPTTGRLVALASCRAAVLHPTPSPEMIRRIDGADQITIGPIRVGWASKQPPKHQSF
ncbi:hypothetical protein P167DRAFT_546194 [Morchella conica CCBAS932]|uniref:Uncharacterized protein n=1 Tax=Morchella conica CCBAS932 TaxID=1392247 RepID=A0A3N4KM33_9PEZI|nr:hypothetical protein P167DRAFT_546194 [Morchella conica CCBAS932]